MSVCREVPRFLILMLAGGGVLGVRRLGEGELVPEAAPV